MLFTAATLAAVLAVSATQPTVKLSVSSTTGVYTLAVDGKPWYESNPTSNTICIKGKQTSLTLKSTTKVSGTDLKFGPWTGTTASFGVVDYTFKSFSDHPNVAVGTVSFPNAAVDTTGCGTNQDLTTHFPAWSTTAARGAELHTLSWRSNVMSVTAAAKGLDALKANGLDCGPVASTDPTNGNTLVWSTLDSHKIVPQTTVNGTYSMGLAGAIPKIPQGFNHSILFTVTPGGPTAGVYGWGDIIQGYSDTTRLPSVTLSDIGYYTDDGAYYYVWGGGGKYPPHDKELSPWIPMRPWPAEVGLIKVKEALYAMGVPVAYMQLDDWWYQGPFYMGNVKGVVDWHASNSTGLFPNGLPAFSDKLDLPLQLYTPWWMDNYESKYRTFESTVFHGTKLVVPDDSYAFFCDYFDLGKKMTNGRFNTFEVDFLDMNFKGCADCFEDVGAADRWYHGMADAAQERNITIQYCLASATDMLASLTMPAVVQARASGDYARPEGDAKPWSNVVTLGGASLLLGATKMAPSKDTLWTASPQPPTSSDRTHVNASTQPHVDLDSILATLSLGPVGISDGLGETDASLIQQAFMSATDSTLLRPSRPLSTVDAVFTNQSVAGSSSSSSNSPSLYDCDDTYGSCTVNEKANDNSTGNDVRSTHATLSGGGPTSHYVLAWMTTSWVTLQSTDLYPQPAAGTKLAIREHYNKMPNGMPVTEGCEDGKPARNCIQLQGADEPVEMPPVGGAITDYVYIAVYEPASNGAYFLGELNKFVHVSPQRFDSVLVKGGGPCGLTVSAKGTSGTTINVIAVDPKNIVHVANITFPKSGKAEVVM